VKKCGMKIIFVLACSVLGVQAMQHWVGDGCNDGRDQLGGQFKSGWEDDSAKHEVQCCNDRGVCMRNTDGIAMSGNCFSSGRECAEGSDSRACRPKTYSEAKAVCEEYGQRLCTKDETKDPRFHNCCGRGCQYDHVTVWTSTPLITTATTATTTTTTTTSVTSSTTTTNTIIQALQGDLTEITKLMEAQILKTESKVSSMQTQIANLVQQNAADKKEMSAYKAEIAGLKATLALKLDKPSKLPFAKPLFSACSKDETACAPSVEANEVGTLEMNSCCGSVVINSKECTVSPCELLNDLNVVKELLGI